MVRELSGEGPTALTDALGGIDVAAECSINSFRSTHHRIDLVVGRLGAGVDHRVRRNDILVGNRGHHVAVVFDKQVS